MIRIVMMLVTGVVLFGLSAAASMFLKPAGDETGKKQDQPPTLVSVSEPDLAAAPASPFEAGDSDMASGGVSAETVLRLSESIRKREKQLQERERIVVQQEKRLKFMIDDLQRERQEIAAMVEEAEARAEQARTMLEQVQLNTRTVATSPGNPAAPGAAAPQPAEDRPMSEDEKKNLRTVAEWLKSMPPEQAAESIRTFCNDGKMEMAVKLLSFLEQRDAAKILAALQDAALVAQLAERFRNLKRPEK